MAIYISGIDFPNPGEYKEIRIYDNGDVTIELTDGEIVIAHAKPGVGV